MPPAGLFITGTDTGVGKTHITCQLARLLAKTGLRVGIYKPVCSGAEPDSDGRLVWGDVDRLTSAISFPVPSDWVCPQRFTAPVAPSMAARMEGRQVDAALLRAGLQRWNGNAELVLVEGVGGWNAPVADHETVAMLAQDFGFPVVIVAANRLGMINHTLLTIESVSRAGLQILAVIVNSPRPERDESAQSNIELLREMTDVQIVGPILWSEQNDLRPADGLATMINRIPNTGV